MGLNWIRQGQIIGMAFGLIFGFSSCKRTSPKQDTKAVKQVAPRDTAWKSRFQEWPQPYWTAKAKVSVKMGGNSIPVQLSLRAEKGKRIWFSATALGIMEVARGVLDQDSVRIWDKINGRCFANPSGSFGEMLPIKMDILQLQHFFMGRVFWDSLALPQKRVLNDTLRVGGSQGSGRYNATILQDYLLLEAKAEMSEPEGKVMLENSDFKEVSGFWVAHKKQVRSWLTGEQGQVPSEQGLKWEFSKFTFVSEAPDFSFQFPTDCQRGELK